VEGTSVSDRATKVDYRTPEDVFKAIRQAAQTNDVVRVLECHTPETRDGIAIQTLMAVVMMRKVADRFAERGDDRYLSSKVRIDAILDKYGVDISRIGEDDIAQGGIPSRVRDLAASIHDRPAFLAEVLDELEAAKGGDTTGFQDELVGTLADVTIHGQYAEANVVQTRDGTVARKPIYFKNTEHGWRVHFPLK
jgi:hypothetical protein